MPLKHFDAIEEPILTTDASTKGLGATLWQVEKQKQRGCREQKIARRPIAFAYRFLNDSEKNYAPNELELLAVIWGVEYFKHYLMGRNFRLETDHKALISVFNRERVNKDYSPRLIRWRHRLLPYEFDVFHNAGKTMRITDYLSRSPCESKELGEFDDGIFTITLNEDLNRRKNEIIKTEFSVSLLENGDKLVKRNKAEKEK